MSSFIFQLDLEDSVGIIHNFLGTVRKPLGFIQPYSYSVQTVLLWKNSPEYSQ